MEETISGRSSRTARRPGEPYTSATKRKFTVGFRSRRLLGVLHRAGLPDHDDLDHAWIL
jgi:ABC-type antimicrobial peptide transport system ATPase subunit